MEKWNYEEITFNDCVDTSQVVEKSAFYKKAHLKSLCHAWIGGFSLILLIISLMNFMIHIAKR